MSFARYHALLSGRFQWTGLGICAVAGLLLPHEAPCQLADAGRATIEEITVTARKFAEDIYTVPMSVQALSGDFIDGRGLSSFYELQFDVPGLVLDNRGMFGAGIALRGVTDQGGASLAIAPHFDGVYLGRSNLFLARMFDVERVEVIKGPQGTLYGRNATGGSVNVITRAPEEEFGAAFEGVLGSFNTMRVQGHLNIPTEKVAVRLAMVGSEGDGYIRNSVDNRRFAEDDYVGIRSSIRVQPTSALRIDVTAQHVEDDGATGDVWLPRRDYLPDPDDIRLTTVTLDDPYLDTSDDFASADLSWEFTGLTLRSITGYAHNLTRALDDCAGSPQLDGCVRGVRPLEYEQRSQELRLESTRGESFDWLVGAFYFNGNEHQQFHQTVPLIASQPINNYTATTDVTALAMFGSATFPLGDRWNLSGGLRLSQESQRVAKVGDGLADSLEPVSAQNSWDNTSWRLGVEYSPDADLLIFANVSTGFKNGGVTTERLPDGALDNFDPERLLAYEAGVSRVFPGRRSALRASAFYYDFSDMQVRTIAILANRITSVIDNAAAARIFGLDLATTVQLSDRTTLMGAIVWMPEREFIEFIDATNNDSFSGNALSRAPEWSASVSIAYRVPLVDASELAFTADYNYRSAFFFTKENDPVLAQEAFGLLNLGLRFESSAGRWYAFATARNVLGADYFLQAFIQSSPGYPANYEAGIGMRF